jgi:replicative DNA helicase
MTLLRRKIDSTIENKVVTGLIVSDWFIKEIEPIYKPKYIKNDYIRRICDWAVDYYRSYNESPKSKIQDIFDLERDTLDESQTTLINSLLTKLSKDYIEESQTINDKYIFDKVLTYFKSRELEITATNIKKLIELNRVEEAEEEIARYKQVAKLTSGWVNPLDDKHIYDVFDEDTSDHVLTMPGALGEMLGPLERSWFVAVLGTFKKGKSWYLQEFAIQALSNRLKVAFVSLEMKGKNFQERLYKRITAFGTSPTNVFLYPTFDCYKNQVGSCTKSEKTKTDPLIEEGEEIPSFSPSINYKPCVACRGTSSFVTSTWYEQLKRPEFTFKNTSKSIREFRRMYGNNLRIKVYPKFTANVKDFKRDLDLLEQTEDFIPDIIIIDYADILKPENPKSEGRQALDETWKTLGGLAAERHCLLITASQGTRKAIDKRQLSQDDIAEWIGKLAHVDVFFGINQTDEEKEMKVLRVNLLAHRHKEFDESVNCWVLQQLELGQSLLDVESVKRR